MMFGVRAFSHADEKFSLVPADATLDPECVTQIHMAALIERAAQSDSRLYGKQYPLPRDFLANYIVLQGSQAARRSSLYS
jgi:hypothetical protein